MRCTGPGSIDIDWRIFAWDAPPLMRGIVAHVVVVERSAIRILQDAALPDQNRVWALMALLDQLLLEALRASHAHPNQVNMVIQQLADAVTFGAGLAAKFQHNPDVG